MSEIKKIIRKTPIIYPIWHNLKLKNNKLNEKQKIESYRKYNMSILDDISKLSIDNNYKLICAWGTLLGIIRDNELLPWDDDLDFILLNDGDFSWKIFDSVMRKNGFWLYREFEEDCQIVEKSYKKKGVLCDVRIWDDYDKDRIIKGDYFKLDGQEYPNGKYCEYEMTSMNMVAIHDVIKIDFKGIEVLVPGNSEEFLCAAYGPKWNVPDPNYIPNSEKTRVMRKATYFNKPLFK